MSNSPGYEKAIAVANISKTYRIWKTPAQRIISPFYRSLAAYGPAVFRPALEKKAQSGYQDFHALRGVSFEVGRGEAVGIIGRNGAGKSTLLQILCGTTLASGGTLHTQGKIAALLELGAGFNPEFTGRENVFLNAAVLGLTERETQRRFPEIVEFADIGSFIDQPIKTYSSGMMVRLAFATQTAIDPDILIVDEALSVGDFFFQQKCFKRIAELRAKGTTILFVSHDMGSVRDICSRALYLRQGEPVFFGDSQRAIALYYQEGAVDALPASAHTAPVPSAVAAPATTDAASLATTLAQALWRPADAENADTAKPVEILAVTVLDARGQPTFKHPMGSVVTVKGYFRARQAGAVHVALELKNRHGAVVSSLGTRVQKIAPGAMQAGEIWEAVFEIKMGLEAGQYSFQFCIGRPHQHPNLGVRIADTPWLGPIHLDWDYSVEQAPFLGMFDLPSTVRVTALT